jgi:hypothetical protein
MITIAEHKSAMFEEMTSFSFSKSDKYDYFKLMITLTVITLSGFDCSNNKTLEQFHFNSNPINAILPVKKTNNSNML